MKIGFAILSHAPPGEHFYRLLERLSAFPQHVIVVHHDYSQSDFPEQWIKLFNLKMVNPSFKTKWGHISKVPAMLGTIKLLLEEENQPDWIINLSPSCYPIKRSEEIIAFLEKSQFDAYIDHHIIQLGVRDLLDWHWKTLFTRPVFKIPFISKHGKFYIKVIRKKISLSKTPFTTSFQPYTGSEWLMLNRKAAQSIVDANITKHPIFQFVTEANSFSDMNCAPDELIFQTIIGNQTNLLKSGNIFRYIDWENAVNWHPNFLGINHFERLLSTDALWGRKFHDVDSKQLVDKIDKVIHNL